MKIIDGAHFCWTDSDTRMRYCYHFAIQPYNLLVEIEGVLSYEDIQCQLRAPLWGYVSLLPNERSLELRFDDCNEGVMKFILDASTKQIDSALKQVGQRARQRAIRRLSKHAAKISTSS